MPGIKNAGSVWEVSYKWRMADKQEFDRWSMEGEDSARQHGVGVLLSQDSFTRRDRDLRDPEKRRFSTSVRVQGDLLRRMQNAGRQPQIVWLDAMVRIHDSKLGRNVVRRVNPAWGPDFYLSGVANVRMELTRSGAFRWTRRDVPSLALEKPLGVTVSGGRSQE
ncbi:MAG TPA: hypothetical protein VN282_09240 [Pyrinomonadaceae bacterium]|nr:hypothetical protein [Pyrinomonadaceae bacterium]